MNNLLQKYRFHVGGMVAGAIGGLLYWKYVGCITGSCMIASIWYHMIPYGAMMGFLAGGIVEDWFQPKKN